MKKVAVVTGSRRGIGLATAKMLAGQGYHVVLSGTAAADDELAESFPGSAEYIGCRLDDDAQCRALAETVMERCGRIDLLVNNAGMAPRVRADLLEMSRESFDEVLRVNLRGPFFLTQDVARRMIALLDAGLEDYTPRIVNVSSMSAYTASVNRGEYCISKAGVSMATMLFAARLAEFGIPVFEVRPGIIRTDMTAGVSDKYQRLIDGGLTPIKRMGTPEDVAACVCAAAGGLLDFATGQVINADGGFHIRRL